MADAPFRFLILSKEQFERKMPKVSVVGGHETLSSLLMGRSPRGYSRDRDRVRVFKERLPHHSWITHTETALNSDSGD